MYGAVFIKLSMRNKILSTHQQVKTSGDKRFIRNAAETIQIEKQKRLHQRQVLRNVKVFAIACAAVQICLITRPIIFNFILPLTARPPVLFFIIEALQYCLMLVDPVIYAIILDDMREAYKALFWRLFRKWQCLKKRTSQGVTTIPDLS